MESDILDVCIIGGGISGIAAAYELAQTNLKWALLQSNTKLGGRIQSVTFNKKRVDIGAYQLAGFSQKSHKNKLYEMINAGLCELNHREGIDKVSYYDEFEGQFTEQDFLKVGQVMKQFHEKIRSIFDFSQTASIEECLLAFQEDHKNLQLNQKQNRLFNLQINMIEQEDASEMRDLSARELVFEEGLEEDQLDQYPLPLHSYHELLLQIIKRIPIQHFKLGWEVKQIIRDSQTEKITIMSNCTEKGNVEVFCKKVICAVPLSVLKNKGISFTPQLPAAHLKSINDLSFGVMDKIFLAFQEPFWDPCDLHIKIAAEQKGKFSHFINLSDLQMQSFILCCFITGDFCQFLHANFSDEQIASQAVGFLKKVFPLKKIVLMDWYVTNWASQPFIHGSFSYMSPSASLQTTLTLRSSVENWLWVVGEHCYGENIGCAHGAYQTGFLAAQNIISLL